MSIAPPPVLGYSRPSIAREMSLTVGILALAWAAARLAFTVYGLAMTWSLRPPFAQDPLMAAILLANIAATVVLLLAGVMLLQRRGRILLIVFAALSVMPTILYSIRLAMALYDAWLNSAPSPQVPLAYVVTGYVLDGLLPAALALMAALSGRLCAEAQGTAQPGPGAMHGPLGLLGLIWGSLLSLSYVYWGLTLFTALFIVKRPFRVSMDLVDLMMDRPDLIASILGALVLAIPLASLLALGSALLWTWRKAPGLLFRWAIVWLLVQAAHAALMYGYFYPQVTAAGIRLFPFEVLGNCVSQIGGSTFSVFLNLALPILMIVLLRPGHDALAQQS